jgi:hypothetical protein
MHLEVDAAQDLGRAVALAQFVDRDRRLGGVGRVTRALRSSAPPPAIDSRTSAVIFESQRLLHDALRLGDAVGCDWSGDA